MHNTLQPWCGSIKDIQLCFVGTCHIRLRFHSSRVQVSTKEKHCDYEMISGQSKHLQLVENIF